MKKILITLFVMVFIIGIKTTQGQGWYMIDSGKCLPASDEHADFLCGASIGQYSSPAQFIKNYKEHSCELICPIRYSDVREGGKVVQVTINYCPCYYGGDECSITFYRLERCKTEVNREKEIERRKQKRLKEYE